MAETKQVVTRFGGCFPPAITPEKLKEYRALALETEPAVKDVMEQFCDMVDVFLTKKRSDLAGTPHASQLGTMIPLREEVIQEMDRHVPYSYQREGYEQLFDAMPTGIKIRSEWVDAPKSAKNPEGKGKVLKEISEVIDARAKARRDAAQHLLWYAKELMMDRQPMTKEEVLGQV